MPARRPEDVRMTAGDVCEVADVVPATLDRWCAAGYLGNLARGGRGNHRSFGMLECVAAAFGEAWRRNGASPEVVRDILQGIVGLGLDGLLGMVQSGRTFWLLLGPGDVPGVPGAAAELVSPAWVLENLADPADTDPAVARKVRWMVEHLDLGDCARHCWLSMHEISMRPAPRHAGTKRGLAGTGPLAALNGFSVEQD